MFYQIKLRIGAYYANNLLNTPIYKILDNSGVECVIEAAPETDFRISKFSATNLIRNFTVILEQHNANATLSNSLELIYSYPDIRPFENPIVKPRMLLSNQEGESFEKSVLIIPESQRLQSLL
jgi:hypothetical protein